MNNQDQLNQYVNEHFMEPVTRSHKLRINRLLRQLDDSDSWPIMGKFNATERALRCYYRICRLGDMELADCVYSYVETINRIISQIVNDERNW